MPDTRLHQVVYVIDPNRQPLTRFQELGPQAVAQALRAVADDLDRGRPIARHWIEDGELVDLPALARYLRMRQTIDAAGLPADTEVQLPGVFAFGDQVTVTTGRYTGRTGRVMARQSDGTYAVARIRNPLLEILWGWAVLTPHQLRHAD